MHSLAWRVYLDSELGVPSDLPHAGSPLENPYVFDDAAGELKSMADQGLISILAEHTQEVGSDKLIDKFRFMRLR